MMIVMMKKWKLKMSTTKISISRVIAPPQMNPFCAISISGGSSHRPNKLFFRLSYQVHWEQVSFLPAYSRSNVLRNYPREEIKLYIVTIH